MNKTIYLVSFSLFLCLFLSGCVAKEIDMFENGTVNNAQKVELGHMDRNF